MGIYFMNKHLSVKEINEEIKREYSNIYNTYKIVSDQYLKNMKAIRYFDIINESQQSLCAKRDYKDYSIINGKLYLITAGKRNNICYQIGVDIDNIVSYFADIENGKWVITLNLSLLKELYLNNDFWDNFLNNKALENNNEIIYSYSSKEALSYYNFFTKGEPIISYKLFSLGKSHFIIFSLPLITYKGEKIGNIYFIKDISFIYNNIFNKIKTLIIYSFILTISLSLIIFSMLNRLTKRVKELSSTIKNLDNLSLGELKEKKLKVESKKTLDELSFLELSFYSMSIEIKELIEELKRDKEVLEKIAYIDPLTKVYNRRYLYETMNIIIPQSKRGEYPLSLCIFDIDDFKQINDKYGHDVGDKVLETFGEILKKSVRSSDIVARLGGEEFVVVLQGAYLKEALSLANKIRKSFNEIEFDITGEKLSFSVSGGVAELDKEKDDLESLIKKADIALYVAKKSGKNKIIGYKPGIEENIN